MIDRRTLMIAGMALVGLGLAAPAQAADVNWKFYTYFGANDKPTQLHRAFAEDIGKASDGRFKIDVYSAGELPYAAADVLRVVAGRQVEIGDVALGFAAGDAPELNALSMPFSCTSMDKFFSGFAPKAADDINEVLTSRFNTASVMQWVMPPQQLWLRRSVDGLDGIRSLKVRTWNREQAEMMRLLGGSGVTISPAEVVPALQRGVVDGVFTAAVPALDWKLHEIADFGFIMNLTLAHQIVAVNKQALDQLPDDLRELLLAKSAEWAERYREEMIAADAHARTTLSSNGMTLHEATPEEVEKLRTATRAIADAWSAQVGERGASMLALAHAECD